MKTLIFSDVHLKATPQAAAQRAEFAAFLRGIDPAEFDRVIVLGDLFDFWFEYRHVVFSEYFEALRAFAELRDAGVELHLVCGNHDFWAGRFLAEELGITIHADEFRCMFNDKRALLVHGDGQNPEDVTYRLYKRIARSRIAIGLFRLLHPDWAMGLAQFVSNASRNLYDRRRLSKGGEARSLRAFAERALSAGDTDVVLCGHTHDPVSEAIETPGGEGLYINTGDWMNHRTYIEWDGAAFKMKTYETREQPADDVLLQPDRVARAQIKADPERG